MIIGLSGRAGAGKDTVCGYIKEWGVENHFTVKREGFADRLKWSAARIFYPEVSLEDAVAWCNLIKEDGTVTAIWENDAGRYATVVSGRALLQRYGTEAHRDVFGEDFWIDAALSDLSADITVVTDARFPNEAEAIRDRAGEVWRIERESGDVIAESAHSSEVALPEHLVDRIVYNVSTLGQLRDVVFREMDYVIARCA